MKPKLKVFGQIANVETEDSEGKIGNRPAIRLETIPDKEDEMFTPEYVALICAGVYSGFLYSIPDKNQLEFEQQFRMFFDTFVEENVADVIKQEEL